MGDIHGFQNIKKKLPETENPASRVKHYKEFYEPVAESDKVDQAARCMDCGVPFCHNGCPLGNLIPDFNNAVYDHEWQKAYEILTSTNNFPEFTGRICPAPCEASCVLGINNDAVSIEFIEKSIIEKAFEEGWVKADQPPYRTNKKVAVVGSGPAGLAAAAQLNKAGHNVTVYERNDKAGGLLQYGIPDFKLEKNVVERRIKILEKGGITFVLNHNVGVDTSAKELEDKFDAILLCGGSTVPRNLEVKGNTFKGVHFAMDYLEQSNRRVAGETIDPKVEINVTGEDVVVIGGGDTGSDCIGTSNRLKAKSITQLEILSKPPEKRDESTPWPLWPLMLKVSSSHEEGADREFSVLTKEFVSDGKDNLTGIKLVEIEWSKNDKGGFGFNEIAGTERILPCTKAFLAMGFLHPLKTGLLDDLNVELDERGNVKATNYATSVDKVFAAGDMRRGQSLVVWAISEGREAAITVDKFLMNKESLLSAKTKSVYSL